MGAVGDKIKSLEIFVTDSGQILENLLLLIYLAQWKPLKITGILYHLHNNRTKHLEKIPASASAPFRNMAADIDKHINKPFIIAVGFTGYGICPLVGFLKPVSKESDETAYRGKHQKLIAVKFRFVYRTLLDRGKNNFLIFIFRVSYPAADSLIFPEPFVPHADAGEPDTVDIIAHHARTLKIAHLMQNRKFIYSSLLIKPGYKVPFHLFPSAIAKVSAFKAIRGVDGLKFKRHNPHRIIGVVIIKQKKGTSRLFTDREIITVK